jgi:predicted GNAT family acetyltransferase
VSVVDIASDNLPEAKAFLERSTETSLFLLSNIRAFGTLLGESGYSGNLKGCQEDGRIAAVFCLTRSGSLLAQTGGRSDLAAEIVEACRAEGIPIRGVLGEWNISKAIWDLLRRGGRVRETVASREVMYRLDLIEHRVWDVTSTVNVRLLGREDHDQWEQLSADFLDAVGLPTLGDRNQRMAGFTRSSGLGHWWGAFEDGRLVSMIGIIALHEQTAQIGGVFTPADRRRRGYNRAVLAQLLKDSRDVHQVNRIFLFTGEDNVPARSLYESMGFERFGHFGLFFGEPQP